jgi:hypothetical protein
MTYPGEISRREFEVLGVPTTEVIIDERPRNCHRICLARSPFDEVLVNGKRNPVCHMAYDSTLEKAKEETNKRVEEQYIELITRQGFVEQGE